MAKQAVYNDCTRASRWREGGWLARTKIIASPNFDQRPSDMPIELLVIHYISLPAGKFSGPAVVDLFMNRLDPASHPSFMSLQGLRVSAHFFIRRNGQLIQFVACDQRAWHAGRSEFKARTACNDFSIGVELEGDGEHPFTARQYARLLALMQSLLQRYPSLQHVRGHSDIAPGRKQDPGPFFDWRKLGEAALCLSRDLKGNLFLSSRLAAIGRSALER